MSRQDYQDQQWSAQLSASDDSREQKALVQWLLLDQLMCLFIHPHDVFEHICTRWALSMPPACCGRWQANWRAAAMRAATALSSDVLARKSVLICTSGTSINMSKRSSIGPDSDDTACCAGARLHARADHRITAAAEVHRRHQLKSNAG